VSDERARHFRGANTYTKIQRSEGESPLFYPPWAAFIDEGRGGI
jgi:hypothetical protein